MNNSKKLIILIVVCGVAHGFNSPLKEGSSLFIVFNTKGNEDFVCPGALIHPSLIVSIGDCARSMYFSSNDSDIYVYDDLSNRKYIRRHGFFFIRNVALIKTEEPIVTKNPDDYVFKLATDVNDIDYTKCKLRSVESDIVKDYSCASADNQQNVTEMATHNYINCAVLDYDNLRYGDLLTCAEKNSEEMILVGFEYHLYYVWNINYPTQPLSLQFTNLSNLGIVLKQRLKNLDQSLREYKHLNPENNRIFSILNLINEIYDNAFKLLSSN